MHHYVMYLPARYMPSREQYVSMPITMRLVVIEHFASSAPMVLIAIADDMEK